MKNYTFPAVLLSLFLIFYLFYIGKSFFIPLAIAIVAWYLIIAVSSSYEKIHLAGSPIHRLPALMLSIITLLTGVSIFVALVNSNIGKVLRLAPSYQAKFSALAYDFMGLLGLDQSLGLSGIIRTLDVSELVFGITGMFTTIAGYTSVILIYTIFLLLEYRMIGRKIELIFKDSKTHENFLSTIKNINTDINTYLKIKTLASLSTALLSYLVLRFIGVDLAEFWALLIFLLNYIPTIGSIVAVFFPLVITLVQFDSIVPFTIVAVLLILIQIIIGNVLEPKYMGKSLNLSPLVIILSLTIWGSIWGVVGMFLCVPIMVITNIILAKFDKTRPIAIILSATGKVK